jgi:hypothetical protein
MSVASFNNSVEVAWQSGITSFDFALSKLVLRIIDVMLNPQSHDRQVPLRSQGMIIERSTVRRRESRSG